MARTNLVDVRATLAGQSITFSDEDLNRYIAVATAFVDAELADGGHGAALLQEIEKYLTAHFAVLRDVIAGVSSQTEDDASVTYTVGQVNSTELLQSTHFGQVATTLDVSGSLLRSGRPKSSLQVL